jgi:hypothetical protein
MVAMAVIRRRVVRIIVAITSIGLVLSVNGAPSLAAFSTHPWNWNSTCRFTPVLDPNQVQVNSYAYDPIVSYQIVPSAHAHSFYGSSTPTINQNTTESALQAATDTMCAILDDKSAYWQPTLYRYQLGSFIEQVPLNVNVYIGFPGDQPQPSCSQASNQTGLGGTSTTCVNPFPIGTTMIAGDGKCGTANWTCSNGTTQATQIVYWTCTDSTEGKDVVPPDCSTSNPNNHADSNLDMHIKFPSCWDGLTTFAVGTQDMSAHFAYPVSQACPVGFPYPEPKLDMQVTWAVKDGTCAHIYPSPTTPQPNCITLSSGTGWQDANSVLSGHADFFDAWPTTGTNNNFLNLIHTCLNADALCGTPKSPSQITFSPTSAHVGDTITITGMNFCASRPGSELEGTVDCSYGAATAVRFTGASSTSFTTVSDTSITATVPAGAVTGPISVRSPGHAEVLTLVFGGTSATPITILP